jgi:peptidoglycan-N-acetylglucosamine deacetylase
MEDQRLTRDRKEGPARQKGGRIMSGRSIFRGMGARLAATRFIREALEGKREPLSPALFTGMTALLVSGLLLLIRSPLVVIPLGCFILLCLIAPFLTGVGFFLSVISRRDTVCREVALTFDDGPDPDVTPRLLELLRRHGVPATFFVAGARAERHPGLIRDILSRNHTLGNHSYHHDPLLMLRSRVKLREEVARTQDVLSAFAVRPLTFRPPVGITNPRLLGVLRELGMYCVTFSCRAFDRGNRRIAGLAEIILKKVRPGDIILLHDVAPKGGEGIGDWLVEMEGIVSGLKGQGYQILPLEELIDRPVMERLTADKSPS